MQLNSALCLALAMLIIAPLYSMEKATQYQGNNNLGESLKEHQKRMQRQRQVKRDAKLYYAQQNADHYNEEFGQFEKEVADALKRRKNKLNNK